MVGRAGIGWKVAVGCQDVFDRYSWRCLVEVLSEGRGREDVSTDTHRWGVVISAHPGGGSCWEGAGGLHGRGQRGTGRGEEEGEGGYGCLRFWSESSDSGQGSAIRNGREPKSKKDNIEILDSRRDHLMGVLTIRRLSGTGLSAKPTLPPKQGTTGCGHTHPTLEAVPRRRNSAKESLFLRRKKREKNRDGTRKTFQ
ncbi:hypothetical protein M404DRAFT_834509 [Pisolithus tinctorius Marx 270]|uniref:Uncharacterized protein n=1 Tax=Pisolithus tinctorius Marx 270 TaxID=870435 RepID=A0A0C3PBQ5_PISTI|nr:hypothetical protein M404DRAFT_834509 [Pisolithus tinctorius Marx 270]